MKVNSYKKSLDSSNNRYRLRGTREVIGKEPEVNVFSWKSTQSIFNLENDMLKSLPKFNQWAERNKLEEQS